VFCPAVLPCYKDAYKEHLLHEVWLEVSVYF